MKSFRFFHDTDCCITILLFIAALFTFVVFKHAIQDVNAASRLSMCLALLDDGSFIIDKYEHNTIDKSFANGHYYCDKAPGSSFLAFPFVAVGYHVFHALGRDDFTSTELLPNGEQGPNHNFKIMLLIGSIPVSVVCAAGIAVMYLLGRLLGAAKKLSFFCAVLLAVGTPFGVWATVLYGHSLSASLLLIGLYLGLRQILIRLPDEKNRMPSPMWIAIGFLLAYAVLVEYPTAVAACLIGLLFPGMEVYRKQSFRTATRTTLYLVLGAIPVAVVFFAYNTICFGGPLKIGYNFVGAGGFAEMDRGFYGIKHPDTVVLLKTFVDSRYGILYFAPWIILSPIFAVRNIVHGNRRDLNILALLIPAFYFLLNSSYSYWYASHIPCRHVTPAFPFLVLPLLSGWKKGSPSMRCLFVLLFASSYFFSTGALLSPCNGYYAYEYIVTDYPSIYFLRTIFLDREATNLFFHLGMKPWMSYLPLIVVYSGFARLFCRELRDETDTPSTGIGQEQ